MEWLVYMVQCADDSLYTGVSTDVEARVKKHNSGTGARYTRSRRPVRLVYEEKCLSRGEALKREAQIKRLTREGKIRLLQSQDRDIQRIVPD